MDSKNSPIRSLLEQLRSSQVQDLILEQGLAKDGYTFYYGLDNHDIHKYCFPGNLNGTEWDRNADGKINFELESDKITAYEEFFGNIGKGNYCFFLDEYISELIGLREQIILHIKKSTLFNYADSFNNFLRSYQSSKGGPVEDFTLYISVATGLLRNGAQRLNRLLQNPQFTIKSDDLDKLDIEHKDIIRNAFAKSSLPEPEIIAKVLYAFSGRKEISRYSKQLDIEAVSRMIAINRFLLNLYPEDKILFLFLSSTISGVDVFLKIQDELPLVGGNRFNFHRTVEQLFLSRLLIDLEPVERIKRLSAVKELIVYRESQKAIKIKDAQYMLLEDQALEALHELRENYVRINLARVEQFKTTLQLNHELDEMFRTKETKQRISGTSTSNLKNLFNNLKRVADNYGAKEDNEEYIMSIENAFKVREVFGLVLKQAISQLLQQTRPLRLNISRGKDSIKGTGQHLPIVFNTPEEPYGKSLDEIAELYLDQFAFLDNNPAAERIFARLREMTENIYRNDFDSTSLTEKLVYCLYLLVLPDSRISIDKSNNDYVEELLRDIFESEIAKANSVLYADYLYTFSWVLRRNKSYEVAKQKTQEGIERFPKDARFYHGRFLIKVCQFPDAHNEHLEDIQLARKLYPQLLEGKPTVIQMNIEAALLNSELYTTTYIVETKACTPEKKLQELTQLRQEMLETLKKLTGPDYKNYPEFLHTEAFLGLQESKNDSDLQQGIQRVETALQVLNQGRQMAEKLIDFDETVFLPLQEELEKRRMELKAAVAPTMS